MPTKASEEQITRALVTLPGWTRVAGGTAIRKSWKWTNFNEAWGFMARVALLAEQMNHHPE
jgi:4a-hydroxytetrahydrobiopterin dehydratase